MLFNIIESSGHKVRCFGKDLSSRLKLSRQPRVLFLFVTHATAWMLEQKILISAQLCETLFTSNVFKIHSQLFTLENSKLLNIIDKRFLNEIDIFFIIFPYRTQI